MAFNEAVQEVVAEHARLKLRLHIWSNGKVVAVPAKQRRKVRG